MVEAICFSEKLATTYKTKRRHNPEDHYLNYHRRENLKSYYIYLLSIATTEHGGTISQVLLPE
jgi:hypothetical protein